MNYTIDYKKEFFSYPTADEVKNAVKICCGRFCKGCESPVEYAWRKRRTDLSDLMDLAIERELSPNEKKIIKDVYFNNFTVNQYAKKENISRNTAYSTHDRALKKLKNALQYVVMYQQDSVSDDPTHLRVLDALQICSAKNNRTCEMAEILKNYRLKSAISLDKTEAITSIPKGKIFRIEYGEIEPTFKETVALCKAYGASIDDLARRIENE